MPNMLELIRASAVPAKNLPQYATPSMKRASAAADSLPAPQSSRSRAS